MLRSAQQELRERHRGHRPGLLRRDPRRDARQRRRDHARDAPRAARPRSSGTTSHYDNADLAVPLGLHGDAVPRGGPLAPREGAGPALRREPAPEGGVLPLRRRQGATRSRAPSSSRARSSRYNNILDTDACWTAVREFAEPAYTHPRRDARQRWRYYARYAPALATEVFRTTSHYDNADLAVPLGLLGDAVPRGGALPPREGPGPALRREPAPEGGVLPLHRRQGQHARARRAAPGQGALVQQHPRHRRCWTAVREFADEPRASSSSTPTRAAPASTTTSRPPTRRRRPPTRSARTAASWRSTAPCRPRSSRRIYANEQFVEVMIAPDYEPGALELLAAKPNLRVLRTGGVRPVGGHYESRAVEGGMLIQQSDTVAEDPADLHGRRPSASPPPRSSSSCSSRGRSPRA